MIEEIVLVLLMVMIVYVVYTIYNDSTDEDTVAAANSVDADGASTSGSSISIPIKDGELTTYAPGQAPPGSISNHSGQSGNTGLAGCGSKTEVCSPNGVVANFTNGSVPLPCLCEGGSFREPHVGSSLDAGKYTLTIEETSRNFVNLSGSQPTLSRNEYNIYIYPLPGTKDHVVRTTKDHSSNSKYLTINENKAVLKTMNVNTAEEIPRDKRFLFYGGYSALSGVNIKTANGVRFWWDCAGVKNVQTEMCKLRATSSEVSGWHLKKVSGEGSLGITSSYTPPLSVPTAPATTLSKYELMSSVGNPEFPDCVERYSRVGTFKGPNQATTTSSKFNYYGFSANNSEYSAWLSTRPMDKSTDSEENRVEFCANRCESKSDCVGIAVHLYDPQDDPAYIKPQICSTIHNTNIPKQTKPTWWSSKQKNNFYKKKNGSNLICS